MGSNTIKNMFYCSPDNFHTSGDTSLLHWRLQSVSQTRGQSVYYFCHRVENLDRLKSVRLKVIKFQTVMISSKTEFDRPILTLVVFTADVDLRAIKTGGFISIFAREEGKNYGHKNRVFFYTSPIFIRTGSNRSLNWPVLNRFSPNKARPKIFVKSRDRQMHTPATPKLRH